MLNLCLMAQTVTIHKFENPIRAGAYFFAFVLLALHLLHGLSSSLKSLGTNKIYTQSFKGFTCIYSTGIPFGFCIIAIFHYYNNL